MQHIAPVTTTEHKIGKVTYLVCSSASERATDTLDKKIKSSFVKTWSKMLETPENRAFLYIFEMTTGSGAWYNLNSTNTTLVCRWKGGRNVTGRQDHRIVL